MAEQTAEPKEATALQALAALEDTLANATNLKVSWAVAQAACARIRSDLKEYDELKEVPHGVV